MTGRAGKLGQRDDEVDAGGRRGLGRGSAGHMAGDVGNPGGISPEAGIKQGGGEGSGFERGSA